MAELVDYVEARDSRERMTTSSTNRPVNREMVEWLRPATDLAISKAIHEVDPERIHARLNSFCPWCPTVADKMKQAFVEHVTGSPEWLKAREMFEALLDVQDEVHRE